MTGEQILKLHMRGSELPPLPMRKVRATGFECTVKLELRHDHGQHDPAQSTGRDSKPLLIGPSGETVEVAGMTAIVLAPGDTLYLTVTLTRESFRKLGLRE